MLSDEQILEVSLRVNKQVNHAIDEVPDRELYGESEKWVLPVGGRGDCEDFVLEKMRRLLDRGVPAERLSIAVGIDRHGDNHAVLLLHARGEHLVLDSLTDEVVRLENADYRMLAMQSPEHRRRWEIIDRRTIAHLRALTSPSNVN